MHKVMCINRHIYDADKNTTCPHCGSAEQITEDAMGSDSIGATTWLGTDGKFHTNASDVDKTRHISNVGKTVHLNTKSDDIDATVIIDKNKVAKQIETERRCYNCFEIYTDKDGLCPHCGHSANDPGKEPYYLNPGTILAKRYIVGQALGAGGFGITYKAWDNVLNTVVAIKEYFPNAVVTRSPGTKKVVAFSATKEEDYAKGLKKFLEEARIMSQFSKNENVCNTNDYFEENNTAYIVMEFLRGNSLKDYLQESGYWPSEEESINIILQVLAGLEEIHKKNIVHLDIAPDNIWLLPDKRVKIIDFGAARHLVNKTEKREVIVKRGFAPYEQYLENGNIGTWTDIYAVGATLYYLLTKRVPLESSDRYSGDVMEPPCQLSLASQSTSDTVMRAMAVQTELRYRNAREFIDDIKKDKVRSVDKELKRRKRRRTSFLLSVLFAGIILVAGSLYATLWRDTLLKEDIVVWLASESSAEETEAKQQRYEEAIAMFNKKYPKITVNVVMKEEASLTGEFLSAEKQSRPDLVEIPNASTELAKECIPLNELLTAESERLLGGVSGVVNKRSASLCPLGMYISVIYAEKGQAVADLTEVTEQQFLNDGNGFLSSYSNLYFSVRAKQAGRYDVVESRTPQMVLTEVFGIYERDISKSNVAETLLAYLLTDAAQDVLHIQNQSLAMPITTNALSAYLDIYTEFDYFKENRNNYMLLFENEK